MNDRSRATAHAWLVRGRRGLEEQYALTRGFVMHAWDWLPNLNASDTPAEIAALLNAHPDYDAIAPATVTKHANELYAFVHEIEVGDLAVYPRWADPELLHVGQVVGPYEFRDDLAPETRHIRRVRWLGPAIQRSVLSDPLRHALTYRGTIRDLGTEAREELQQAVRPRPEQRPAPPDHASEATLPGARELEGLVSEALADLGGTAHRRELMPRALELGRFSAEQRAIPAPPSKRKQYASQLDYRLSWALHHLHRQGAVERVGPGVWSLSPDPLSH